MGKLRFFHKEVGEKEGDLMSWLKLYSVFWSKLYL